MRMETIDRKEKDSMERKYELLLLAKPTIGTSNLEELLKEIENKFFNKDKIVRKENWGLKKTAYKIENFEELNYVLYYVLIDTEKINDIKEFLSLNKEIVRYMLIHHEKKWPFEMKSTKDIDFSSNKKQRNNQNSQNNQSN